MSHIVIGKNENNFVRINTRINEIYHYKLIDINIVEIQIFVLESLDKSKMKEI